MATVHKNYFFVCHVSVVIRNTMAFFWIVIKRKNKIGKYIIMLMNECKKSWRQIKCVKLISALWQPLLKGICSKGYLLLASTSKISILYSCFVHAWSTDRLFFFYLSILNLIVSFKKNSYLLYIREHIWKMLPGKFNLHCPLPKHMT